MRFAVPILLAMLAACRGEPVPRDYQNAPPAMTHPPHTSSQTPAKQGMPGAAPEPSSGAEGKNVTREQVVPPGPATTTAHDQSPATTTQPPASTTT